MGWETHLLHLAYRSSTLPNDMNVKGHILGWHSSIKANTENDLQKEFGEATEITIYSPKET